jgi:hypothetical protein
LYPFSGDNCGTTAVYANTGLELEDGKTITLTNDTTATMICGVSYWYSGSNYVYSVTKTAEEDYFKLIPTVEWSVNSNDDLMINLTK